MATLAVPNTFSSGQTPSAAQFNANFEAIEDFINDGDADTNNISTNYSNVAVQLFFGNIASGNSEVRRFKVPAAQTLEWTEAQIGRGDGGGTATLQFTDDTSNVLSSSLASDGNDEVETSTGFAISSSAPGSEMVVTVTGSVATTNDICVTLWAKVLLRS